MFERKLGMMSKIIAMYVMKDYTEHTQKNGAVSKVIKKCISHPTRAQHTLSAAGTVHGFHVIITSLQYMHLGPRGNQTHRRLGVACPL
jgi:hypothetical protein